MNKFNLNELTVEEINLIVVGLLELPGKYTSTLIPKIREQVEKQGARSGSSGQSNLSSDQTAQGSVPVGPLSGKVVN